MIVGTAGHIDHGKTTLVRALSGVDTDRLAEEKARGISIELGYAYVPLADGATLGFVDVPGHERLVQTMAAGASGIDFMLLVVAADDGVMPQTREHLAIVDLFGVTRGAVAITKTDRVDAARLAAVREEIAALLWAGPLRGAPLFALDARDENDGAVVALRGHLAAAAAAQTTVRNTGGLFRLAVDRVFSLPGHGTIATGTVHAGVVRVGDAVGVMPAGIAARVRGIHANHRESDAGAAGQRCALNLAGVDRTQLARGDWLADARAFLPGERIDVRLRVLAGATALRDGAKVHVHLGTTAQVARVVALEGTAIGAGDSARVQLVFAVPICAATGDRFIARDAQAHHTLGGGRVLDANAPVRKRRSAARRAYLDAVEAYLDRGDVGALLAHSPFGLAVAELERICSTPADALALPSDARRVDTKHGTFVVTGARWEALLGAASQALGAFHAASPDAAGADVSRLRRVTAPAMPDALWRALIDELIADGAICRSGAWLHTPAHRVTLTAAEAALGARIAPLLDAGGFDPPWVRDVATTLSAPEADVRRTLRKLATQGDVHALVPDLFYASRRVAELAAIISALCEQSGAVEAAAFRDRIGVGRKRAIQILEFFDRAGYTRRVRNAHRLRAGHAGLF